MGRPARNHGGTGGRGYVPLPGERPNFNYHVLDDTKLQNLVQNRYQKLERSTKIETLKDIPKSEKKQSRVKSQKPSDNVILNELKNVKLDRADNSVSTKETKENPCDSTRDVNTKRLQMESTDDYVTMKEPKKHRRVQRDLSGDSATINESNKVQNDESTDLATINQPMRNERESSGDSVEIEDTTRMHSNMKSGFVLNEPKLPEIKRGPQAPEEQATMKGEKNTVSPPMRNLQQGVSSVVPSTFSSNSTITSELEETMMSKQEMPLAVKSLPAVRSTSKMQDLLVPRNLSSQKDPLPLKETLKSSIHESTNPMEFPAACQLPFGSPATSKEVNDQYQK